MTWKWVPGFVGYYKVSDSGLVKSVKRLNRDPANNNLNNLRYGTPQQNAMDRVIHGTDFRGERSPSVILTKRRVRRIRRAHRKRILTQVELATIFEVSTSAIQAIIRRRTWRYV